MLLARSVRRRAASPSPPPRTVGADNDVAETMVDMSEDVELVGAVARPRPSYLPAPLQNAELVQYHHASAVQMSSYEKMGMSDHDVDQNEDGVEDTLAELFGQIFDVHDGVAFSHSSTEIASLADLPERKMLVLMCDDGATQDSVIMQSRMLASHVMMTNRYAADTIVLGGFHESTGAFVRLLQRVRKAQLCVRSVLEGSRLTSDASASSGRMDLADSNRDYCFALAHTLDALVGHMNTEAVARVKFDDEAMDRMPESKRARKLEIKPRAVGIGRPCANRVFQSETVAASSSSLLGRVTLPPSRCRRRFLRTR